MDPATLTAIRSALSALALAVAVLYTSRLQSGASLKEEEAVVRGEAPNAASEPGGNNSMAPLALLSMTSSSVLIAGIELGLYNFAGTALEAISLQLTSASKAGFIIRATAVITPALSYIADSTCLLAFGWLCWLDLLAALWLRWITYRRPTQLPRTRTLTCKALCCFYLAACSTRWEWSGSGCIVSVVVYRHCDT